MTWCSSVRLHASTILKIQTFYSLVNVIVVVLLKESPSFFNAQKMHIYLIFVSFIQGSMIFRQMQPRQRQFYRIKFANRTSLSNGFAQIGQTHSEQVSLT